MSSLNGFYMLKSFNGEVVGESVRSHISLRLTSEGADEARYKVRAKVANTLSGNVTLKQGVMKGTLVSTRMMGSERQMDIERALGVGFSDMGMRVTLKKDELILTAGDDVLAYKKVPILRA